MTGPDDRPATVSQLDAADALGRLIARAGERPHPPADLEDRVRQAVHAVWRQETASRSWSRRWALAVAATVAVVAAAVGWQLLQHVEEPPITTAGTIERTFGEVSVKWRDGTLHRVTGEATSVRVGDGLTTGLDGGARVRFDLVELRIARGSRLLVLDTDRLRLEAGAIFVDSGSRSRSLAIETPAGSVSHVGTRYQVVVARDATTVIVREGQVRLATTTTEITAGAEEKVVLSAGGRVARSSVPAYGAEWRWADALAEPVRIDGLALTQFLEWVAVETGRTLSFASEGAESSARSTTLHGSIAGMSPEEALRAVLTTTNLSADVAGRDLVVERKQAR